MITQNKAFTMVELLIVLTIVAILTTVWFLSYSSTLYESRNWARIADMWNLKVSLKNYKLKSGSYPLPWNSFSITNYWSGIITQWFLDEDVSIQEITKKPKDPLVKDKYYSYSISNNKLFFQIAMTLEWQANSKSFVDWDYQQIGEFVPSMVFATSTWGEVDTLSWKFILDWGTYNLPYDELWIPYSLDKAFADIIRETWITISKFAWYYTCQEIYENGSSMGSGTYIISDANWVKTSTWCIMNY